MAQCSYKNKNRIWQHKNFYKKIKASERAAATKKAETEMYQTVTKIQKLKEAGKTDEAMKIIDAMTEKKMGY